MSSLYSPSSREDFSFCPRMWWLRKNGLVSRTIEYPELCAVGGNAVGRAMEEWNNNLIKGLPTNFAPLAELALNHASEALNKETKERSIGGGKANDFIGELPTVIVNAVRLLFDTNPLKPYAIVAAEESFPHAGGSRLDVRVKQPDGRGIVFDYKVKFGEFDVTPNPRTGKRGWLDKEFEKHFSGEQRITYTHLTNTDMFGIILVVLKPTINKKHVTSFVEVKTVGVTEDEKKVWLRDALLMTPEMDHVLTIQSAEKVRGRTYPHANNYGDCKFSDACLRYQLDAEKMSLDFMWIKKEDKNG